MLRKVAMNNWACFVNLGETFYQSQEEVVQEDKAHIAQLCLFVGLQLVSQFDGYSPLLGVYIDCIVLQSADVVDMATASIDLPSTSTIGSS